MPGNNWIFGGRTARRVLALAAAQVITAGTAVAERVGTVDRYSAVIGGDHYAGPFYAITTYTPYEEQGTKFLGLTSILQKLNACFHPYRYEGKPITEMWYEQRTDTTPQQALDSSVREIRSWGNVNKDISFGVGSTWAGRVEPLEQCIINTINDNFDALYQTKVQASSTTPIDASSIPAYIVMGVAGMGMLIFLSLLLRPIFKAPQSSAVVELDVENAGEEKSAVNSHVSVSSL